MGGYRNNVIVVFTQALGVFLKKLSMKNGFITQINELKVSSENENIKIDLPIFRHDFYSRFIIVYMIGLILFVAFILSQIINLSSVLSLIVSLTILLITYYSVKYMIWISGQNIIYLNNSVLIIISKFWWIKIKKKIKLSRIKSIDLKEINLAEIEPKHYYFRLKRKGFRSIKFGIWIDKANAIKVLELIKNKNEHQ